GVPLIAPGGVAIGALAVMSRTPRTLESRQVYELQALAAQIMGALELDRPHCSLPETARPEGAAGRDVDFRAAFNGMPVFAYLLDPEEFCILAVTDDFLQFTERA